MNPGFISVKVIDTPSIVSVGLGGIRDSIRNNLFLFV